MTVTLLEPVELKAMLKGPDRQRVLVVDVRDDDFYGGHIAGAVNIPVHCFGSDYTIDDFIESRCKGSGLETVVVHCYLSQQRGPFAARRLASRMQELGLSRPEVCLLSHGFRRFKQLYGADPELVADDSEEEEEQQRQRRQQTESSESDASLTDEGSGGAGVHAESGPEGGDSSRR